MNDRILLIRTGGTIDAEPYADPRHPPVPVTTLKGKNNRVLPAIETLPNYEQVDAFSWCGRDEERFVKDSGQFTPEDMKELARIIKEDEHRHFVITHGTDFIVQNAAMLKQELEGSGKVIVLAGAIVPLSMPASDGKEVLGYTLEHITQPPPGVYVVGRDDKTRRLGFFDPDKVQKNRPASLESGSLMFHQGRSL